MSLRWPSYGSSSTVSRTSTYRVSVNRRRSPRESTCIMRTRGRALQSCVWSRMYPVSRVASHVRCNGGL